MSAQDYAVNFPTAKSKGLLLDEVSEQKILAYGGCIEVCGNGYAYISTGRRSTRKRTLLHRFIMDAPQGVLVDHINRNRLDNRLSNLRLVDAQRNSQNTGFYKNNKSGYMGVRWNKQRERWHSLLTIDKKVLHLGFFDNLEDAASCRYAAETQLLGEFAPNV